ncbi:hypothetical protein [Evansella cellulosilytica]|uniref:Uncharacterized protein n=1 Tax=Evansella cellulosilytica (strain ATCC 21833 / DSM 2522 / FERM P-1141 / JCM 9156 / N-4) TaxID=649639 RepID=E6TQU2_EVAC2|nr:hypothetical protein [Evansella cellulosilytica]ADU31717.1 hypothetical protein Bcell_3475 [Evansella cellulosilytica DSM 2522]
MENEKNTEEKTKKQATPFEVPFKPIVDKFSKHKDSTLVYGETIDLETKKVLPVARIRYIGGGGGGFTQGNKDALGEGGGGGGYISVKPVGVYEITENKTTFKPPVSKTSTLSLLVILTFGIALLFTRKSKLKMKNFNIN